VLAVPVPTKDSLITEARFMDVVSCVRSLIEEFMTSLGKCHGLLEPRIKLGFIISMSAKAAAMVVPIGGALTDVVVECPKNIGSDVAKNLNNSSQAPRGVLVGHKFGFKPVKQVYRHVSKKKKDVESRREVSVRFKKKTQSPRVLSRIA
ncbi:hypothetical protein Tco_1072924, partial [Tanacetum coccineum]